MDSDNSGNAYCTANESIIKHRHRWRRVRFNVESLNKLTGGGLPARGIIELAGDAGSGKTQLALHLALVSQIAHVQQNDPIAMQSCGVVYICTEHPFPSKRLIQMETSLGREFPSIVRGALSDAIFVEHLYDPSTLEQCISERLPVLLENNPIGLLVIDSITAVYGDAEQNYVDRAHSFRRIVQTIHRLQDRYDFATVCTNQVRSVVDESTLDDGLIVPALGLAWSSLVHMRLQLTRTIGDHRSCRLLFSPTAATGEASFQITSAGISDLNH
ncbi:DNA repair protein XRCC3 isoform X2 [Uranotaenia lowii]|uniref:DNA repair protein XRCC3 isoform X2 n=1 Tax=Uranotaenia lowii TaxID=190385 RepID=UPI00247AD84B|nr:DNA repair protein XRCC3 isoform X2 [Uranotaenia lowii]XP_055613198.1 DNA repair protein XRCC3 isoform X2 [Uranotaenia lowii]